MNNYNYNIKISILTKEVLDKKNGILMCFTYTKTFE